MPIAATAPVSRNVARVGPSSENSMIIFDWDDTLLPTSYLRVNGMKLDRPAVVPEHIMATIAPLEVAVVKLLKASIASAKKVVIITNAETGWVELTAARYMPSVVDLLRHVEVFSARSTYEADVGCDPYAWKREAFRHVIGREFAAVKGLINLIQVGDSAYEREALMGTTKGWSNTLTKSVKFCERPTVELMKREVEMVVSNMEHIVGTTSDLDLMMAGAEEAPATPKHESSCRREAMMERPEMDIPSAGGARSMIGA